MNQPLFHYLKGADFFMKNCVIYARYSSERQREESIEGQIRVCTDFAAKNDLHVIHTYIDRAESARTDRRPQFQIMIHDCPKRQFDYVLVYKLNRFARNRYDSAVYKHKIKKFGVKVLSAMEHITDDPSGILLESVIEGMAEFYSVELAENVTRGMEENALEGKSCGGTIPLGYTTDADKHLIIDPMGAKIVRLIFQLFNSGYTYTQISDILNKKGYKTASNKPFHPNSYNNIMRNKKYIGILQWKDIEKEGIIAPILDKTTFYTAQKILDVRKHPVVKHYSREYHLTGKMFCDRCGAPFVGTFGTSKKGQKYYYYGCSNRLHGRHCKAPNISRDKTEDLIIDKTVSMLRNKECIDLIAKQAVAIQKKEPGESLRVTSLKNQVADVEKRLKNCIHAIENGLVSVTVSDNIQKYEKDLSQLREELSTAKLLDKPFDLTEDRIKFFLAMMLEGDPDSKEFRDKILNTFVRKIIVHDDCLEVHYNYTEKLPILNNNVRIRSSNNVPMVTR